MVSPLFPPIIPKQPPDVRRHPKPTHWFRSPRTSATNYRQLLSTGNVYEVAQ